MTPWYTDTEIDDLCAGLVTNAAKARHLRGMGLTVSHKPNGRPSAPIRSPTVNP